MSGQADKFKIGIFVVASLLLGAGVIIWLGASRYFSPSQTVVAYFNETVQGLNEDSPVKFRGVTVGRVARIRMAPDAKLVEVVMNLHENFKVTKDLGIKTSLLGLTGMKYLEMDRVQPGQTSEIMNLDFKPPYPVINTYPSNIREFGDALDNIFRKVKTVDLGRISTHLLNVSAKLDQMLNDPKVEHIGADAADAIKAIKQAATKINIELDRMRPAVRTARTLDKASEFLQEITQTARSADRLIRRTDNNVNRLSQKLDRSADNLLDFTRMLKSKPSSIIFGGSKEKEDRQRR